MTGVRPGDWGSPGGGGPAPVEVAQVEAARLEDDTQAVGTLRARRLRI